jgi:hypothetical protein
VAIDPKADFVNSKDDVLVSLKQYNEAIVFYKKVLAIHPESADAVNR